MLVDAIGTERWLRPDGTAWIKPELSYDRMVTECFLLDGRDLGAELVRSSLALDWPQFFDGKYRRLEPEDAQRKLWRAHARQRGMLSNSGRWLVIDQSQIERMPSGGSRQS